jgi:TetR/AcrR family transcriptional regulator of autoinduction and epiphytic fitness
MPPRKRDTSKKRTAILEAAARVFVRDGYDRASMDLIAEEARASKRTVYNHFQSKEALFGAVVQRFMSESQALKRVPYRPDESLSTQLDQFAYAMLELTRNPIWLGLMRVITTSPAMVTAILDQVEREEDTLATWLRHAAADERVKVPDPELVARAFWAMLSGAFLMPAIFAAPVPEPEAAALQRELVAMFLARYAESHELAGS